MIKVLDMVDVFVSYAAQDGEVAGAVCAGMEAKGIRCWIAPRDVGVGDWAAAIEEAVGRCRVMVVVWSERSNQSRAVMSEVARALSKRVVIIPFRVEKFEPSNSFRYLFSTAQWFEAHTPPLGAHIDGLASAVLELLRSGRPARGGRPEHTPPPSIQASGADIPPDEWGRKKTERGGLLGPLHSWLDDK